MNAFDLTLPTVVENLALDHALALHAEAAPPQVWLRFWELPHPAVVLGANGVIAGDVNLEACRRDGVPLARRSSGGGTVLLGRGCLLYSLVLPYNLDPALASIDGSYRWIAGRMASALGGGVAVRGGSDLALGDVKVSGNAQERKRSHVLHHGTLLYAFDLTLIARYLREPSKQPDYRGRRPHDAFVRNLDVSRNRLIEALCLEWGAGWIEPPQSAVDRMPELVAERFGRLDWIERR